MKAITTWFLSKNLQGANLWGADLQGADLQGANLRGADLQEADLQGANLQGADLDFSCWPLWCGTVGAKIDIKQARQLLAHAFIVAQEFMPPTEEQKEFMNKFHRIESRDFPKFK